MGPIRSLSKRDTILVLLGASFLQLFYTLFYPPHPDPFLPQQNPFSSSSDPSSSSSSLPHTRPAYSRHLPETEVISHAPGWTLFRNLYMSNGTLYIVSPYPKSYFPPLRLMTSVPLYAENTPENIAAREPTDWTIRVLSVEEANKRWRGDVKKGERNRVWSVDGGTLLYNDPDQFLGHYYHFCAELLLGTWAFWYGNFFPPPSSSPTSPATISLTNTTLPLPSRILFPAAPPAGWRDSPGFNPYFLRAAFPAITVEDAHDWDDRVAASVPPDPAIPQPHYQDAHAQHSGTISPYATRNAVARAWLFDTVLLSDRSAAHRGARCGSRTQRTASESLGRMRDEGKLGGGTELGVHIPERARDGGKEGLGAHGAQGGLAGYGVGGVGRVWWEPVRRAVLSFAGVSESVVGGADGYGMTDAVFDFKAAFAAGDSIKQKGGGKGEVVDEITAVVGKDRSEMAVPLGLRDAPIVITYISRQGSRRRLRHDDHEELVRALEALVARKNDEAGWVSNIGINGGVSPGDGGGRKWRNQAAGAAAGKKKGRRWELSVVQAERLSKDEQVRAVGRTTIMLGVHGNGLSHLILMPPSPFAAVIEFFLPGGFAHDYEWTSGALGIGYFAMWNDTYHTSPATHNMFPVYPEGFHGTQIPVYGPSVAKLVEDWVEGRV